MRPLPLGVMIRRHVRIRQVLPVVFFCKNTSCTEKAAFSIDAGAQGDFDVLGEELLRIGSTGLVEWLAETSSSHFGTQ